MVPVGTGGSQAARGGTTPDPAIAPGRPPPFLLAAIARAAGQPRTRPSPGRWPPFLLAAIARGAGHPGARRRLPVGHVCAVVDDRLLTGAGFGL